MSKPVHSKIPLSCYGCGTVGVVRSKCTTCQNRAPANFSGNSLNSLTFYQTSLDIQQRSQPLLPIIIDEFNGAGFADSGAQVSIAGVKLCNILKDLGYTFEKMVTNLSYADGKRHHVTVLRTKVVINIENREIPLTLTVLPYLTQNHTLLGCDCLQKAGIVLDIPHSQWFFCDEPKNRFVFVNELLKESNVEILKINTLSLRSEEGNNLSSEQRYLVNQLIIDHADIFKLDVEPTSLVEHHIDTGAHSAISIHPYPLGFHKKEFLRQELDKLLSQGITEECESPWASPIVLVPKKDTYRLSVDYRRVNSITVPGTYPMPRLDELLQTAKAKRPPPLCLQLIFNLVIGKLQLLLKIAIKLVHVSSWNISVFAHAIWAT